MGCRAAWLAQAGSGIGTRFALNAIDAYLDRQAMAGGARDPRGGPTVGKARKLA
jgi:hypothetical protein